VDRLWCFGQDGPNLACHNRKSQVYLPWSHWRSKLGILSPDGKLIASGSWDKTVQVWDAATGAVRYTYNGYNVKAAQVNPAKGVLPDLIFAVAWSHNGKRIAAVTQVYCGDNCGVVLSWDAYTGRNFSFYVDQPIFAMAWSPDDKRLVTSIVVSAQGFSQNGYLVQISQA
jgi:WD40 repeat protein